MTQEQLEILKDLLNRVDAQYAIPLSLAIWDVIRMNKIERLHMSVGPQLIAPSYGPWSARSENDCVLSDTLRAAVDGVSG